MQIVLKIIAKKLFEQYRFSLIEKTKKKKIIIKIY